MSIWGLGWALIHHLLEQISEEDMTVLVCGTSSISPEWEVTGPRGELYFESSDMRLRRWNVTALMSEL